MYKIITDSSCDLPANLAEELGIEILPLSVRIGSDEFLNYLDGREIAPKTFYGRLRAGELAQTSAINIDYFTNVMEAILKDGYDILYLGFSSALSRIYLEIKGEHHVELWC